MVSHTLMLNTRNRKKLVGRKHEINDTASEFTGMVSMGTLQSMGPRYIIHIEQEPSGQSCSHRPMFLGQIEIANHAPLLTNGCSPLKCSGSSVRSFGSIRGREVTV